jgi:hypothetical protein
MKDVMYALKLKNEDLFEETKFINLSNPESDGSLLVNLIYSRECYDNLLNKEDVNYHDKLIYRGKFMAVTEIIRKSNLYEDYYNKAVNYGCAIEKVFYLIKDFEKLCRKSLRQHDRNSALTYLSASYEVNNILSIIDRDYVKRCRKENYGKIQNC